VSRPASMCVRASRPTACSTAGATCALLDFTFSGEREPQTLKTHETKQPRLQPFDRAPNPAAKSHCKSRLKIPPQIPPRIPPQILPHIQPQVAYQILTQFPPSPVSNPTTIPNASPTSNPASISVPNPTSNPCTTGNIVEGYVHHTCFIFFLPGARTPARACFVAGDGPSFMY